VTVAGACEDNIMAMNQRRTDAPNGAGNCQQQRGARTAGHDEPQCTELERVHDYQNCDANRQANAKACQATVPEVFKSVRQRHQDKKACAGYQSISQRHALFASGA
jgi:hypothetical protein